MLIMLFGDTRHHMTLKLFLKVDLLIVAWDGKKTKLTLIYKKIAFGLKPSNYGVINCYLEIILVDYGVLSLIGNDDLIG